MKNVIGKRIVPLVIEPIPVRMDGMADTMMFFHAGGSGNPGRISG